MLRGTTDLPLHYGKSPRWLFERMTKLARAISKIIVDEYGTKVMLERLSEPYWFQSFACVLGFDWHSSGTTTVTLGALKEALKKSELSEELVVVGGKGKTSRKTPQEIKNEGEKLNLSDRKILQLIKASKLAAKVDNAALQDGFDLYHHSFIFTKQGNWCIVQQGMNSNSQYARRYHWLSNKVESFKDFVNEPHAAIVCDKVVRPLNMVASEADEARAISLDIVKNNPIHLKKELELAKQKFDAFSMPREHFPKIKGNIKFTKLNFKAFQEAYEMQPESYEELLLIKGMGPSTVKALALISNLIYGSQLSWRDPCKYAFAHGGKDGWPYHVDRKKYDKSIEILKQGIKEAKLERKEKLNALKRLRFFVKFEG